MIFSSGNIFRGGFGQPRFGWNGGYGNPYGYNWGMQQGFGGYGPGYPMGGYGSPYGRRRGRRC
jgi:hypothetical protein